MYVGLFCHMYVGFFCHMYVGLFCRLCTSRDQNGLAAVLADGSCMKYDQKRPIHMTKEAYVYDKRDLHVTRMDWLRCWRMARVLCMTKETYRHDKRNLCV